MSRTSTQLATTVLRKLGVIDALETPSAQDVAYVKSEYVAKLAEWDDRDLVYWSQDAIPEAVYNPLALLMINEVQGAYGRAQDPQMQMAKEEQLLHMVRRHIRRRTSLLPVVSSDY